MKKLVFILLWFYVIGANAAVRFNPNYNRWEGNICMNNLAWQFVDWQPIGSICHMFIPNYGRVSGVIINN